MASNDLAAAVLTPLGVWVVLLVAFIGLGLLGSGAWARRPIAPLSPFALFWTGWACVLLGLQVVQLWRPIDAWAASFALAGAVLGWALYLYTGRSLWLRWPRPGVLVTLGLIGMLGAALAADPLTGRPSDTGLYHLATVRWFNTYALVPGLGNLHMRLAQNSAFFLYLALLNVGPLAGQVHHLGVGILVVVFLWQAAVGAIHIVRAQNLSRADIPDIFLLLFILPVLVLGGTTLSTTSNDIPVTLLEILASTQLLKLLTKDREDFGKEVYSDISYLSLLCFAGIIVKLSFAAFGLTAVLVGLWIVARRGAPAATRRVWRAGALVAGIGMLALLPWSWREVVESGYPLYPSTSLALPVDWRMPESDARAYLDGLIGWARSPGPRYGEALENWNWVGPWFRQHWRGLLPPVLLGATVALGTLPLARRRSGVAWTASLSILPATIALAAWFLTAPDPRFAGAVLWVPAAVMLALAMPALSRTWRYLVLAAVAAWIAVPFHFPLSTINPANALQRRASGMPDIPPAQLTTFTTRSGLDLYVPSDTDLAWDAPLPSTPTPDAALRLRCPNDLRCGFTKAPPEAS
jgi:hypothetical protein